jgi:uncharacterized protein (DUF362 family)
MSKASRNTNRISRRDFLKAGVVGSSVILAKAGVVGSSVLLTGCAPPPKPVVSIAKINDGNIDWAVKEAIDLLGGIETVMSGKKSIMLKPNLVSKDPRSTTNPEVVRSLAVLMQNAKKTVSIGEGSAVASGFNVNSVGICYTYDTDVLNGLQQSVFDSLGYTTMAKSLDMPLVNLHTGDMVEVTVPRPFLAYERLTIHQALDKIDLLCSVPMMKTHNLASVSLGMKNLIGVYPGSVYGTIRFGVHDHATAAGSPGMAFEIVDMVRVNKLGLVVIDGSTAMEGDGPANGILVPMNVIIAGTNPLATDMVAADVMGFKPEEVPTFVCANNIGMRPHSLDEIEIRGVSVSDIRRNFVRPCLHTWAEDRSMYCPCPLSPTGCGRAAG